MKSTQLQFGTFFKLVLNVFVLFQLQQYPPGIGIKIKNETAVNKDQSNLKDNAVKKCHIWSETN